MNAATISSSEAPTSSVEARVGRYEWPALTRELDTFGCAVLPKLLSADECRTIAALYSDESQFRSHIHMAKHGFGKGEYRYFKYPLPGLLDALRPVRGSKGNYRVNLRHGVSRVRSGLRHTLGIIFHDAR